jgi:thiol-disulfide isomerase/thioredoxin
MRSKSRSGKPFQSTCRVALVMLAALLSGVVKASNLDLSAYRGKVVYVDFWASWCAPCRESFPWLGQLVEEYGSKNFVVIGVNVDHDRIQAERFLEQTPANFPIIYDAQGELATAYKVAGMPSAILIDRSGHIRYQHTGFSIKKKEVYEEHLRTLLDETIH